MAQFLLVWQVAGGSYETTYVETIVADDLHAVHPMLAKRVSNLVGDTLLDEGMLRCVEHVDIYEITGVGSRISGGTLVEAREEAKRQGLSDETERLEYERLKKKFEK